MCFGKSIELFWVNGTSDGIITAELSNWNGKGIKIPRTELLSCQRKDICGTGVYFLLCQEDDGTDSVYIGEAENVYERLCQHIYDYKSGKETYYWNTAISFVGRDLNKALIRYVENRLVEIAKECNRYNILTKSTYKNTVIKESHRASMDEFISNLSVLLNAMGYKILVPIPTPTINTVYLYCKSGQAEAKGFISPGGFTVMEGSKVSDHLAASFQNGAKSYYELRKKLEADGTIVDGFFKKNYEFSAPSAASSVVLGRSSNGKNEWKTEQGVNLFKV
ncbi:MAG: GIY-YIG nuclease family protein [Acutalibacteraceae bacterium]|nr:GIY-YIG nuclease family protein [Acutalibacteraceae bacterium]